jgi:hypothetical protein
MAFADTMATKEDIARIEATMATKEDIARIEATMATKEDLAALKATQDAQGQKLDLILQLLQKQGE